MEQTSNIPISSNANITVRKQQVPESEEHPIGIDFAVIGQVMRDGEYEAVIQIDNSAHRREVGTHIHFFDRKSKDGPLVRPAREIVNAEQAYEYVSKYLEKQYGHLMDEHER